MTDSKALPVPAPDPVDIHIGRLAAGRRRSLGLSLADVARALGLDEAGLSDLELGLHRVAARQLWAWSGLLRVPIAWFFAAPPPLTQMIFVPNPDVDWPDFERYGDADTALH